MIVRDSQFAAFGTDWSNPSLWQDQTTTPAPSPLVTPEPTQVVYPNNYVELPRTVPASEATTEDYSYMSQSDTSSGGTGWLDTIFGFAKNFVGQPGQSGAGGVAPMQITQAAPQPSFFSTPAGIVVAIAGGAAVLGMMYFLLKPSAAPVAIYSGYSRKRRKARRSPR